MIHLTRALLRRWLDVLLHIQDTSERTAAAFALGVFFGFSPFLGLHTILAIMVAFLLRLNRVAVLLGVYSNLPWIIAPYYAIATLVGAELTGKRPPPDFRAQLGALFELSLFQQDFWQQLMLLIRPLFWPYMAGTMLCAMLLAAAAYPLALAFIASRRKFHNIIHRRD